MVYRHPVISFASQKKSKSVVTILDLCVEDPASHNGMIKILERLIKYLPTLTQDINQKTLLFGDQLFAERGK